MIYNMKQVRNGAARLRVAQRALREIDTLTVMEHEEVYRRWVVAGRRDFRREQRHVFARSQSKAFGVLLGRVASGTSGGVITTEPMPLANVSSMPGSVSVDTSCLFASRSTCSAAFAALR